MAFSLRVRPRPRAALFLFHAPARSQDWVTAMLLVCLQEVALGCVWAVEWLEFAYQDIQQMREEDNYPTQFQSIMRANAEANVDTDPDMWGNVFLSNVPVFTLLPMILVAYLLSIIVMEGFNEITLGSCVLRYMPSRRRGAAVAASWEFALRWGMAYCLVLSRIALAISFFQTAATLVGLSNGPIDIIMNSLALVFILEMDRAVCHDLPGTRIHSSRRERDALDASHAALRDVAAGLAKTMDRTTPAVLDAQSVFSRTLEVGYAAVVFAVSREIQTKTNKGMIYIADDGWSDEYDIADRVTAVYNWSSLGITLLMLLYLNATATPHAIHADATWARTFAVFAAYFVADVLGFFFFYYVINHWVLRNLAIFGASPRTIPFATLLSGTYTW